MKTHRESAGVLTEGGGSSAVCGGDLPALSAAQRPRACGALQRAVLASYPCVWTVHRPARVWLHDRKEGSPGPWALLSGSLPWRDTRHPQSREEAPSPALASSMLASRPSPVHRRGMEEVRAGDQYSQGTSSVHLSDLSPKDPPSSGAHVPRTFTLCPSDSGFFAGIGAHL